MQAAIPPRKEPVREQMEQATAQMVVAQTCRMDLETVTQTEGICSQAKEKMTVLKSDKTRELELYVHLPFCLKKCDYCDFLSGPSDPDGRAAYIQSMLREIQSLGQREADEDWSVRSVFFGGGTPSILQGQEISLILAKLRENFRLDDYVEISLEANPGTLDRQKLKIYRESGVNRLSLGCQSTKNRELKTLGRIHSWEEFLESFEMARELGFENINVDLMSAIPGQKISDWEENLRTIAQLSPEHISAYSLIIEEGTPYYGRELDLPDEDSERRMYEMTGEILREYGYHQYEISNYAKEERECIHNLGYWQRISYLGIGLGAASLRGNVRYCNTSSMSDYLSGNGNLEAIEQKCQRLTVREQMDEFFFLGLRMTRGVELEIFQDTFGCMAEEVYGWAIEKHERLGLLERIEGTLRLTPKGVGLSNQVFIDFIE